MVAAILIVLRLRGEFVLLKTVLGRTVKRIQRGWIYSSGVLPRKLGAATCSSFLVQFIDFLDQDIDLFRG